MSNRAFPLAWKPADIPNPASRPNGIEELEIDVVFTTDEGTSAALEKAGQLSLGLAARIRLVVPRVVPYACSLDHPPVAVEFIRERMLDLVARTVSGNQTAHIDIYFCRDRTETLLEVLKPDSLVMIGRRRWWRAAKENRLARALRLHGHEVCSVTLD